MYKKCNFQNGIKRPQWNTRKNQSRKTSILTFDESDIGIPYRLY